MKKIIAAMLLLSVMGFSQDEPLENVKTGWNFGVLPAIAYDSDVGFRYGGLTNIYHYGDGSRYPQFNHSIYLEWSRTTKGSGNNILTWDTDVLIPGVRMIAEASYLTEKALDFYGFNGAESEFDVNKTDKEMINDYITRVYYKHDRSMLRLKADFQGKLMGENLRWLGGINSYGVDINRVDIAAINDGADPEDLIPDTLTLYDKYVADGLIPDDQKNGGMSNFVKVGLVYDTRDNEANPMSGIWTEALLLFAPAFMGNDQAYTRAVVMHRQYFTLIPRNLSFAYRLAYQTKLSGDLPWYMLPFVMDSKQDRDGLGGSKNLRGILRNRIVGNDIFFTNLELRWKFYRTVLGGQNIYLALNGFIDGGMVVKPYEFSRSGNTFSNSELGLTGEDEKFHISYGGGFRIAMNENFIVAIDYGMAADKADGSSGLYIGLNYLF